MKFLGKDQAEIDKFLLNMKEIYLKSNQGYLDAAKIVKSMSAYDRNEYAELICKAEDFRSLKKFPVDFKNDKEMLTEKILPTVKLAAELKINELWKLCIEYKKWQIRLAAVQEKKKNSLYLVAGEDGDNTTTYDTQSEFSMQSRTSSKFSVVTGASMVKGTKRPKKPKNLASRNIKEGAIFEEEWQVDRLNGVKIEDSEIANCVHLIDCLIIYEETNLAVEIITEYRKLDKLIKFKGTGKSDWVKTLGQQEFETANPELADLYSHIDEFQKREQLDIKKKKNKKEKEILLFAKYEFQMDM